MDPLPVIPPPPKRKWREFRVQYLPVLVFASVVFTIGRVWTVYLAPLPPIAVAPDFARTPGLTTNLVAGTLSSERGL